MKKIILSLMALMLSAGMATMLAGAEVSVSADVVSSYIWRGLDCGSVSLQPSLGIDCNGLSLGVWASTGLSDPSDTKEIDLVLSYETGGWNFSLVDYWFDEGPDCKNRFFKYAAHATNHVFEGNIGYDFGPLSLQWYTVFAGNDGVNEDGDRAYSSYVELSAPFRFASAEWTATAGFVPFATCIGFRDDRPDRVGGQGNQGVGYVLAACFRAGDGQSAHGESLFRIRFHFATLNERVAHDLRAGL